MNTLEKAVLFTLGIVTLGFILFNIDTIEITLLSILAVLIIIGFLAEPLLPKMPRTPIIIDVTEIYQTTQNV
ncbi:MAG: Unknown protein [uncultured Thiotrichaceae bacterium]|uniref:Uncharacterized protein n=1 Tax=uncultured Thiotrichaceae bacterium TaxID=298394 RepID=A0A6S6RZU9_9GAMM|nr:MAG: Unknown protein [uncultured Thiotrichaceae bacterium]